MSWAQRSKKLALVPLIGVLVSGVLLCTPVAFGQPTAAVGRPPAASLELLSDGQFVFGPNVGDFNLHAYLPESESPLAAHADVIEMWCAYASVNPRVVLTVIEMQSGLVSSEPMADLSRPVGYAEPGLENQIESLSMGLAIAFYDHLYSYGARSENPATPGMRIRYALADGSQTTLPATSSSGTSAVTSVLAPLSEADDWAARLSPSAEEGFVQTYRRLFPDDDPLDRSNQILAAAAPPEDLLQFPFPVGSTWWFNGPHNWNGAGYGRPYSSMDFGTWGGTCANPPNDWSVAAAGGSGYHPSGHFCWYRINHEGGWTTSYYHLRNVRGNGSVSRDENVGTIACEVCAGGFSSTPHVHFTLLYNGAYTEIDGTVLSGWTVHEGDGSYGSGYIERDGQVKYPFSSVYNDGVVPPVPLISETLQLDVYEAGNDGAAGPVESTGVLTDGQEYLVTISGTLSRWNASAWSSVCKGVPEDWPEEPSAGTTNGKVGLDSGYIFAVPSEATVLCDAPSVPPITNWTRAARLELSLDGGQSWSAAVPLYQTYNPDHIYTYVVQGQDARIQFRWAGSITSDNYGVLTIRVEVPPCDLSRQPVVMIPGWEGNASSLGADDQLSLVRDSLGPDYVEGCNLYYAAGLSSSHAARENGVAVQAAVYNAYTGLIALNPDWNHHLDLIAYGYGGLNARAYLESDLYARDRVDVEHLLRVDNLFTLGTPHGGGVSSLPGAGRTIAEHRLTEHWSSLWQMTPWQMQVWSDLYSQPEGVCYRAIGGDGFEQGLPWWLEQWYSQSSSVPNDLAIYRWSSLGLTLGDDHFPLVVANGTPDIHRHTPGYGLEGYRSYSSPADTVTDLVAPHLGSPLSQCLPEASEARELRSLTDAELPTPLVLLSAGEVVSGAQANGNYSVNWSGPSVTYLSWHIGDLDVVLVDPIGQTLDPVTVQSDPGIEYVEMDMLARTAAYVFSSTLTGTWGFTVTGASLPYTMPFRLLAVPDSQVAVTAMATPWQTLDHPVTISAEVTYSTSVPIVGANVQAFVSRPSGESIALTLHDDGVHHDLAASDGVYGNTYTGTDVGGFYAVLVEASGVYASESFTRAGETHFSVSTGAVALDNECNDQPRDSNGDGKYDWLDVTVGVTVTQAGTYTLAADLVAGEGAYIGHSVVRTAIPPGSVGLTLTFDGDDIRAGGLDGPYTVTNLLVADESLAHLLLDRADEPHVTAAYAHQQFGRPRFYLPIVRRGG